MNKANLAGKIILNFDNFCENFSNRIIFFSYNDFSPIFSLVIQRQDNDNKYNFIGADPIDCVVMTEVNL